MDKFLSFWSQHNTVIIEGLVALVILSSLFLAYRSFFAKSSQGGSAENGHGFDAAQLEKTLQKILENQHHSGKASSKGASEDLGMDLDIEMDSDAPKGKSSASAASSGGASESPAEVSQLRVSLSESQQKIEVLQKQLQEALAVAEAKGAEAAASSGGAPAGEIGINTKERDELNSKIKDLEARLAEYEIISEDIADLSRYREENDNLKKELDALKAGGVSAAPTPAAPATPEPAPAAPPEPVVEAAAPAAEPVATAPAGEAPAADSSESNFIDDELMKEFAAAVEGQKNLSQAASKAGSGKEAAKEADKEADQLMNEFENFVTKKS